METGTEASTDAVRLIRDEGRSAADQAYLETIAQDPHNADARYQLAQVRENQGRTVEALAHYGDVIRLDGKHLNGHLRRAKLLHINGRVRDAAADYRRILTFAPAHPTALVGLAHVAYQDGELDEALRLLQIALKHHPHFVFAHHSLGRMLKAAGDFSNAAESFQRAIELDPKFGESYTELASAFEKLNRKADAEAIYRRALAALPPNATHWNGLGLLLLEDGRNREAADCFRAALETNPDFAQAANNLGLALGKLGDQPAAIDAFRRARHGLPQSPDVLSNLAHAYLVAGHLDDAEQSCRAALIIDPEHIPTLSNWGLIAIRRGDAERARTFFQQAVDLAPQFAEGYNNLGTALFALNRDDDAVQSFSRAVTVNPDHVEAHYNRALARFRQGDFEAGWIDYEWRRQQGGVTRQRPFAPPWRGEPLAGKSLLIQGEQGIGDELMFASRYADVIQQAQRCILVCESRLAPLFARSFPSTTVVAASDAGAIRSVGLAGGIDFQIAAAEVPRYLPKRLGDGPAADAYLQPAAERVHEWRSRFAQLDGELRVGISWRGGAAADDRARRSTTLAQWQPLLSQRNLAFVNLQYGDCRDELETLWQQYGFVVHDWEDADPLVNLDDFAAQIAALDLVISVDNSTVHMAGGLGVPTWVALPCSADWRWGSTGNDSYWYRSVRLFRRDDNGAWSDLFRQMALDLAKLAARACRRAGNEV